MWYRMAVAVMMGMLTCCSLVLKLSTCAVTHLVPWCIEFSGRVDIPLACFSLS